MRYTPRERPVMAQRLRIRDGDESRGSDCSGGQIAKVTGDGAVHFGGNIRMGTGPQRPGQGQLIGAVGRHPLGRQRKHRIGADGDGDG